MQSDFIQLNSNKCTACWQCVEVCPNGKIGRINLPWHKHAKINKNINCSGCLQCVKACKNSALSIIRQESMASDINANKRKSQIYSFIANICLIVFGFIMALSGLLIQINYHMGRHGEIDKNHLVFSLDYYNWLDIHKTAVILTSILLIYHTYRNINWFKSLIKKGVNKGNKSTFSLTLVFLITALSGIIPWIIDITSDQAIISKQLIEVHDKIALILIILMTVHVLKRKKTISNSFRKIFIH